MPHIHEKIDFTVEVYIVCKGKVLLRKHEKYNLWLAVGGHIELDEDPEQAALREVKEEVGLDIVLIPSQAIRSPQESGSKDLVSPFHINRHRISDTHEHISLIYFATSETDTISPAPGEAITECAWLDKHTLETKEDILPKVRTYALHALDVAFRTATVSQ